MIHSNELSQVPGPDTLLQGLLKWIQPKTKTPSSKLGNPLEVGGHSNLQDPLEKIDAVASGANPELFDAEAWMRQVIAYNAEFFDTADGNPESILLSKAFTPPVPLPPALLRHWNTAESVPFVSLDPRDYQDSKAFFAILTGQPSEFATASGMETATSIYEAISGFGKKFPQQLLHILNVAYVRTALRFEATALGDLQLNRTPAIITPDGNGGHIEINEAFSADFVLQGKPDLTRTINLSGSHLFSLSRWIDQTLTNSWASTLEDELKGAIAEFTQQLSTLLMGIDKEFADSVLDVSVRRSLATQFNEHPGYQRMRGGLKAHVNLQGYNQVMREFNAGLDRAAVSLALRFGPRNSLTAASYDFFVRPDVRNTLSTSATMGAFAPLILPDELLSAVCGLPRECVAPYKTYLKALEAGCSPQLRAQLHQMSPGYFLRFPRFAAATIALVNNRELLTATLDGRFQAEYADPVEAGHIMSAALSRLFDELGPKALPPGELLVLHRSVLGFLERQTPAENSGWGLAAPIEQKLSIEQRIHGLTMLMGELATLRKRPGATIESAMKALSEDDIQVYADTPNLSALIAHRAPAQKRFLRSHSTALRSSLGLVESISTQSEFATSSVPNPMKWELAIVRITDGINLASSEALWSSQAYGPGYKLSFRAQGSTDRWIHFSVCAARCEFSETVLGLPNSALGTLTPPAVPVFMPSEHDGRTYILSGCGDEFGQNNEKLPYKSVVSLNEFRKAAGANEVVLTDYLAYSSLSDIANPVVSAVVPSMSANTVNALKGHAISLITEVQHRIAALEKTDKLMFAALFSPTKSSFLDQRSFPDKLPARIGVQKAFRLAMVACAGDTRVIEDVAARISNPFAMTSARASLLDVCEHAQTIRNDHVRPLSHLQAVIAGLARNPVCVADNERFVALLERSMVKCLEKEPELLSTFVAHGINPTAEVLSLITELHPNRVTDEVKNQWQAAQMRAEIERTVAAVRASAPAAGPAGELENQTQAKPTVVRRRRVGI